MTPRPSRFVLGSGNEGWPDIYGPDDLPTGLADDMIDAWIAFARTGNPDHENMPRWPAYETSKRPTMIFDSPDTVVIDDPDAAERIFWDGVPFDGVTPTSMPSDL